MAGCGSSAAAPTELQACQDLKAFTGANSSQTRPSAQTLNTLRAALTAVTKRADNASVRAAARDLLSGVRVPAGVGLAVTQHCDVVGVDLGSSLLAG